MSKDWSIVNLYTLERSRIIRKELIYEMTGGGILHLRTRIYEMTQAGGFSHSNAHLLCCFFNLSGLLLASGCLFDFFASSVFCKADVTISDT